MRIVCVVPPIRFMVCSLVIFVCVCVFSADIDIEKASSFPSLVKTSGIGGPHPSATTQQAYVKFFKGELDEAKKLFNAAVLENNDDHAAWQGLALLATGENEFQVASDDWVKAAIAARGSAWGEYYLYCLNTGASRYLASAPKAFEAVDKIADDNTTLASMRDLIWRIQSVRLSTAGKYAAAAEVAKKLQYAGPWTLIGPFDNRDGSGMATAYEPEAVVDFDKDAAGRNRRVSWHPLSFLPWNGKYDLSQIFEPHIHTIAYAATLAKVEKSGWSVLRAGCGGALQIWVNGEVVANQENYHDFGHDKIVTPVYLHKDWNLIVLKSGVVEDAKQNGKGKPKSGWAFDLRLCALEGGPYPGVTYSSAAESLAEYKIGSAGRKTEGEAQNPNLGALAAFQRELKIQPNNLPLLFASAALIHHQNIGSKEDRVAPKELKKAIAIAPKCPSLRHLMAHVSDDSNETRQAAEAAYASHPDLPLALEDLASLAYKAELRVVAEDYIRKLQKKISPEKMNYSTYILASIIANRAAASEHDEGDSVSVDSPEALRLTRQYVEKYPYSLKGWPQWAKLETSQTLRLQLLEKALEFVGGDNEIRNLWVQELVKRGKEVDAAEFLAKGLDHPFLTARTLDVAEKLRRVGKTEASLRLIEETRLRAPEHPDVLEALAIQKHRLGKTSEAVELLNQVLVLKPAFTQAKDYLARIQNGKATDRQFFAPYDIAFKDLKIPDFKLFPGDNVIHLLTQEVIHVNPNGSSSRMLHSVSKLLRPQGVGELAFHQIYYDPERQVVDILRAVVITPDGKELSRADVNDRSTSAASGVSTLIYDEHHLKVVTFKNLEAGAIVDLQYTLRDTGDNMYGDYFSDTFYLSDNSPTIRSQYVLDYPKNLAIQTKTFHTDAKEERVQGDDPQREIMKWDAQNTPGILQERGMPPMVDQLGQVQVSTMKSWQEVGQWYWNLAKDQLALNEQMKKEITELTKDSKNQTEKLRAIHDWVIRKIRYLGIELGRNGYKPHKAQDTYKALYGDCKDSATLLAAMLPAAGIDCKLVLIRTVNSGAVPADSLPMPNLYNHCIAYVPDVDGKAYWIDGTTDFNLLGEVPWSDQGAQVLVSGADGGKFLHIPESKAAENLSDLVVNVTLAKDGSAQLTVRNTSTGQHAPWWRGQFEETGKYERMLKEQTSKRFPGATVEKWKTSVSTDQGPVVMDTELKIPTLTVQSGDRKSLPATYEALWLSRNYAAETTRKQALEFSFAWQRKTHVEYNLAEGIKVASMPESLEINESFGKFTRTLKQEGQKIIIDEFFEFSQHRILAADYEKFRDFCTKVDSTLEQKILLETR